MVLGLGSGASKLANAVAFHTQVPPIPRSSRAKTYRGAPPHLSPIQTVRFPFRAQGLVKLPTQHLTPTPPSTRSLPPAPASSPPSPPLSPHPPAPPPYLTIELLSNASINSGRPPNACLACAYAIHILARLCISGHCASSLSTLTS